MRTKILASLLGAVLFAASLAGIPARPAHARDLIKAASALVLAEDPPPSRSQVLAKQRQEEEARLAVQKAKGTKPVEVDNTPYYKKWWFWALSAAVVGGTVALGAWAIDTSTKPAMACSAGVIGCFGDGRTGGQ